MNPLQTGTPASAITPQGYKNSTQSGNFQSGYSGSDLLESNSTSYTLQVNPSQTLSVKTNNPRQVLGVSQAVSNSDSTAVSSSSGFGLFLPVTLLIVSAALSFYFLKKYINFMKPVESLENE
jgi:hypothetical protein